MKKKIIIVGVLVALIILVIICLNQNKSTKNTTSTKTTDWSGYDTTEVTSDETLKITSGGVYTISNDISNGGVIVDTTESVKLVLNGVSIKNSNGPAILVLNAELVEIELIDTNTLEDGTEYSTEYTDYNAVIYSKDDLVISGTGTLNIKANYKDAITSKDTLVIKDGTYIIESADDGIRGKDSLTIESGNFTITSKDDALRSDGIITIENGTFDISANEGIEATYIKINGGEINIKASDDGINAANKSDEYSATVEINGGNITITMGQGDTDGIDSNGDIIINGGIINVTGNSTFDYDGKGEINGGTVICNGTEVTTLPNQMMGGNMGGGMPSGNMPPEEQNNRQYRRY